MPVIKGFILGIIVGVAMVMSIVWVQNEGYKEEMALANQERHKDGPCHYCPVKPIEEIAGN